MLWKLNRFFIRRFRTLFRVHVATTPRKIWFPTELSVSKREEQSLSIKAWNALIKRSLYQLPAQWQSTCSSKRWVRGRAHSSAGFTSTATDGPTFSFSSGTILILGHSRCKIVTKRLRDTLLFSCILFWLACHIFYAQCLVLISSALPLLCYFLCSSYQPSKWIKSCLIYAVLQPYVNNPLIQILHLLLCVLQKNHIQ